MLLARGNIVCPCIVAASNSVHRHHCDRCSFDALQCTNCTILPKVKCIVALGSRNSLPLYFPILIRWSTQAITATVGNRLQPSLQDLAVLARMCSTFHIPALDHLWRSSDLVNLLRCMPTDVWVVNEVEEPPQKCDMVSGLTW
jgi:hypothetical protein